MEAIEALKRLGIDAMHEQTHIARHHLQAIIDCDFSAFSTVQLFGFLAILEREYAIDTTSIKEAYRNAHGKNDPDKPHIAEAENRRPNRKRYVAMALAVMVVVLIGTFSLFFDHQATPPSLQPESIQTSPLSVAAPDKATVPMAPSPVSDRVNPVAEHNVSAVLEGNETNQSAVEVITEPVSVPDENITVEPATLTIVPRQRLWMGLIDLQSHATMQKVRSEPLILDASRSWLMVFGHGEVDIKVGETTHAYNGTSRRYFILENTRLRELDQTEYGTFNNGVVFK